MGFVDKHRVLGAAGFLLVAVTPTVAFSQQASASLNAAVTCTHLHGYASGGAATLSGCTLSATGGTASGSLSLSDGTFTWADGTTTIWATTYTQESGCSGHGTNGSIVESGTVTASTNQAIPQGTAVNFALCEGSGAHGGVTLQPDTVLTFKDHITDGSAWTLSVVGGGCEVQTFTGGGTWTADDYGDAGTFTGGQSTITEIITTSAVDDKGDTVSASWSKSLKEFTGTGVFRGKTDAVTLVKGALNGC